MLSFNNCHLRTQPSAKHLQNLEMNDKFPDSIFFKIPDSLKVVSAILKQVRKNDQKYRDLNDEQYSRENAKKQLSLDLENQKTVDSIVNIYGILSYKNIGLIAQKGQIFTIIHATEKFQEKYLARMKKAVDENKIFKEYYAIFIDKFLFQKKRLQLYGTQFIFYKNAMIPYPFNLQTINTNRRELNMNNFFTTKSTVINTAKMDSTNYVKLFPEIINLLKIDTSQNGNEF